jgi:hypothetical protein
MNSGERTDAEPGIACFPVNRPNRRGAESPGSDSRPRGHVLLRTSSACTRSGVAIGLVPRYVKRRQRSDR